MAGQIFDEAHREKERALLHEMEPAIERLYNEHRADYDARTWVGVNDIPYEYAGEFVAADGTKKPWSPDDCPLPEDIRSALYVFTLTEDNLPYYTHHIMRLFPRRDHPGAEALRGWTAEEGSHGPMLRNLLTVTRAIDPVWLEKGRFAQMAKGEVPEPETYLDAKVYTTLQESGTVANYQGAARVIGKLSLPSVVKNAFQNILGANGLSGQESLHYTLFRKEVAAAIDINPSMVVEAIRRNIVGFDFPGTGIPDYPTHKERIARAGIFDASNLLRIFKQNLNQWRVEHLTGLTPSADKARNIVYSYMRKVEGFAKKQQAMREEYLASQEPQ